MPDTVTCQSPKLLDETRGILRLHHHCIHTERSHAGRIVRFHDMQSRGDLFPAEPRIEAFLSDSTVNGNVASATQNKALNALVFLRKKV